MKVKWKTISNVWAALDSDYAERRSKIQARRYKMAMRRFKTNLIITCVVGLYLFIRFFHPNVWTAICVVAVVACAVIFLRWYLVKTGRIVEDNKPDESNNSDET